MIMKESFCLNAVYSSGTIQISTELSFLASDFFSFMTEVPII